MGSFIQTLEEIMGFQAAISSLLLITILIICTSNHVGGKYLLMETVDKPADGSEAGKQDVLKTEKADNFKAMDYNDPRVCIDMSTRKSWEVCPSGSRCCGGKCC